MANAVPPYIDGDVQADKPTPAGEPEATDLRERDAGFDRTRLGQ